jgi:hypothetical protein
MQTGRQTYRQTYIHTDRQTNNYNVEYLLDIDKQRQYNVTLASSKSSKMSGKWCYYSTVVFKKVHFWLTSSKRGTSLHMTVVHYICVMYCMFLQTFCFWNHHIRDCITIQYYQQSRVLLLGQIKQMMLFRLHDQKNRYGRSIFYYKILGQMYQFVSTFLPTGWRVQVLWAYIYMIKFEFDTEISIKQSKSYGKGLHKWYILHIY